RCLWRRPHSIRIFAMALALLYLDVCGGTGNDAADGRKQHHPADHFSRRQTRTCDELLHGFHRRHGAIWKPALRVVGGTHRRAIRVGDRRRLLSGWLRTLCPAIASHSRTGPPHLRATWHHSGNCRRPELRSDSDFRDRGIKNAAAENEIRWPNVLCLNVLPAL